MIRWSTDKSHGIAQSACKATASCAAKRSGTRAAVHPIGLGLLLDAALQLAFTQFNQQVCDGIVGHFVYRDLALMANQHLL